VPQELIEARAAARGQRPAVGIAALSVLDPRGKKHHLRRLIAGVVGAVSEMYARLLQRACAPADRGTDGFGGHCYCHMG
jgi:hypothetical protein